MLNLILAAGDSFLQTLLMTEIFVPTITMYVCAIIIAGTFGFRRPFNILFTNFALAAVMLTVILVAQFPATSGHEILMFFDMFGTLLIYPLAFAFLVEWIHPRWFTIKRISYSFAPPLILLILYLLSRAFLPPLSPIYTTYDIAANIAHPQMWIRIFSYICVLMELIVFVTILFRLEMRHRASVQDNFSFLEGTNLYWVRFIAYQLIAYGLSLLLRDLVDKENMRLLVGLLLTSIAVSACIMALRQQELYSRPIIAEEKANEKGNTVETETRINDNIEIDNSTLKKRLINLLENDEVFRDPNLSIEMMYKMLNTNRTYLSRLINQDMGLSFYQLVNSCRIKRAAQMLHEPENKDIAIKDIAIIVGFKSISTFNSLFKEQYGMLPSAWRNSNTLNTQKKTTNPGEKSSVNIKRTRVKTVRVDKNKKAEV